MLLLVTDKKTEVTGNRAVTGGTRVGSRGRKRHERRLTKVACFSSPGLSVENENETQRKCDQRRRVRGRAAL
jgi:hypothetical protein